MRTVRSRASGLSHLGITIVKVSEAILLLGIVRGYRELPQADGLKSQDVATNHHRDVPMGSPGALRTFVRHEPLQIRNTLKVLNDPLLLGLWNR